MKYNFEDKNNFIRIYEGLYTIEVSEYETIIMHDSGLDFSNEQAKLEEFEDQIRFAKDLLAIDDPAERLYARLVHQVYLTETETRQLEALESVVFELNGETMTEEGLELFFDLELKNVTLFRMRCDFFKDQAIIDNVIYSKRAAFKLLEEKI